MPDNRHLIVSFLGFFKNGSLRYPKFLRVDDEKITRLCLINGFTSLCHTQAGTLLLKQVIPVLRFSTAGMS